MGAGPARRRVGRRDELRGDLGRSSERRIVEYGEILVDGPAGQLGWQTLGSLNTLLPVCLGPDQAGVDGKALAADQTFPDAAPHHRLEQAAQQITLAETPVPVLREGRVIGHLAIEAEPTKPAI